MIFKVRPIKRGKKMKNIIKKIELDIDGKRISLTPEQAKKLTKDLNELFGEKEKEYVPYPQPYPIYPYRKIWEWKYEPYIYWTSTGTHVTYCDSDSSISLKV